MSSLDPADWGAWRTLGHRMLDDMFDHLAGQGEGPVWQTMPAALRAELSAPLPRDPGDAAEAYERFRRLVLPYATGNLHPAFMGWVHGGGTAIGMLAELLAGGLNANLGGRDHAPIEVERQVIAWAAEMLGFPATAAGVLVTGTSMANLIGVLTARTHRLGADVRRSGIGGTRLSAYASTAAHGCIPRAMEIAGIGRDALRLVRCDGAGRIRLDSLADTVARDRRAGLTPFLVVGTAGTVDIGAVDDLAGLARFCREEALWCHVDAAFGAIALLARGCGRCWTGSPKPTRWGSISTSGRRFHTTPAASLPAAPSRCWRPSPAMPPICGANRGGWRAAASGRATLGRTCREASAR